LTAENGKNQPYEIFNRGMANYLETQEGLAVYNMSKRLHYSDKQNYRIFALVVAIENAFTMSFSKVFESLLQYNLPLERAFRSTVKVKRGLIDTSKRGCFTKDLKYFTGFLQIEEFIKNGGEIRDLYTGKFNLKDLSVIKKIQGIKPPKHLPKWL